MRGILIFFYVGGAGAKFIANCLTYSQQVAFSNYNIALRRDPEEYHRELLATIPDKTHSRTWLDREHGCHQLFGTGIVLVKTPDCPYPIVDTLNDLTPLADQWLPIMTHDLTEVANVQRYFKDYPQRLIAVDATPEFIDLAIRLKWPNPDHCLDFNFLHQYRSELEQLVPDYSFTQWNPLSADAPEQIAEFARTLDITLDLSQAPAADYVARYQAFHLPKKN